jgi:O-antigen biosynthesis protein
MGDKISIVVLAFNKAEYTARCLAALPHSTWRPLEVILVDNGSTDRTCEVFDDFQSAAPAVGVTVERIDNEENVGASTGRNQALEASNGRYIAFLDNDVVVRSVDWLERLADVLDGEERAGIVGPKLIYPFPPHWIQCCGAAVSPTGRVFFSGRGEPREAEAFRKRREVQCLISACWLMRREVYEQLGGLDEAYNPVQFEDIDYCYRARQAGWRVFCEPSAEMYHFENVTTSGSRSINSPYQIVKNGLRFKNRWREMYSRENGPADSEWSWAKIPTVALASVGETPFVNATK